MNLNGIFPVLVGFGLIIGLVLWGGWELIDWLFIDDTIRVSQPLVPDVEIKIINGVADTTYIYQIP